MTVTQARGRTGSAIAPTCAGLYERVSSEEQVEGYSLDAQARATRLYCEAHGWAVAQEYPEEGRSARAGDDPRAEGHAPQAASRISRDALPKLAEWLHIGDFGEGEPAPNLRHLELRYVQAARTGARRERGLQRQQFFRLLGHVLDALNHHRARAGCRLRNQGFRRDVRNRRDLHLDLRRLDHGHELSRGVAAEERSGPAVDELLVEDAGFPQQLFVPLVAKHF